MSKPHIVQEEYPENGPEFMMEFWGSGGQRGKKVTLWVNPGEMTFFQSWCDENDKHQIIDGSVTGEKLKEIFNWLYDE